MRRHSTKAPSDSVQVGARPTSTFTLKLPRSGILAAAREKGGEFVVLAGSTASITVSGTIGGDYGVLRSRLIAEGALASSDGEPHLTFARDVVFRSSSAAASVICGRRTNGLTAWVDGTGGAPSSVHRKRSFTTTKRKTLIHQLKELIDSLDRMDHDVVYCVRQQLSETINVLERARSHNAASTEIPAPR